MDNEFPDPDEDYDVVEKDDFELLKEIQAQLNNEKGHSKNSPVKTSQQNTFLETDINQPSTSSHINQYSNLSATNSKKRNYDALFGDISDLLETDIFDIPEVNGPKEKRPCWNEPNSIIEAVINARKKVHNEDSQLSNKTKRYQDDKKSKSISLRVPPWNFIAVTRPFDSQRLYVRVRKEVETSAVTAKRPVKNLLPVSYEQLKAEAQEIITNNVKRASLADVITTDCKKVTDTELWVEKYKPKSYMDLLSDESINRQLLHWLKLWDKIVFNKEISPQRKKNNIAGNAFKKFGFDNQNEVDSKGYPIYKIVLLTGPPGLGKTTLAHLAAKHVGYNVIEVNASDERGPDAFRQILRASTQMKAVMGTDPHPNCLILDEIDGAPAASIEELLKFVQGKSLKSKKNNMTTKKEGQVCQRPIICICNDLYTPSLRSLKNFAFVINVPPVSTARLAQRLMYIAEKEKLKIHQNNILKLIENSDCDIRSCLGALQYMGNIDAKFNVSLGLKDTKKGLFDTWKEIFKVPYTQIGALSVHERVQKILKIVQRGDNEKLIQGIFHNYPENCIENIRNVSITMEWFQFYDQISTIILHLQVWSIMPYTNYTFLTCHLNLSTLNIPKLSYPIIMHEVNQKTIKNTGILTTMRRSCGFDNTTLITDISPILPNLINPQIRTVSGHLYTSKEKAQLSRTINIMVDFGLSLIQQKNAEARYEYKLDPDICEIGHFPGCKNRPKIPYAVLQIVAQELQMAYVKRSTHITEIRQNNIQKEVQNKDNQIATSTNSKQVEEPKKVDNNASITPSSSKQGKKSLAQNSIRRNFFGQIISNDDNNFKAKTKTSPEFERTRRIRDIITKYGAWYKYKEGFSNAVRRNVLIKDLL